MGYLSKPSAFAWPSTFDRFFQDFATPTRTTESARWTPRIDVLETEDAYVFGLDVPGVRSEDLEISVENDTLTIAGRRERAEIEEGQSWRLVERAEGSFRRSFSFPLPVDADAVTADLDSGVLTVRVMKAKEAKPRTIKINTK